MDDDHSQDSDAAPDDDEPSPDADYELSAGPSDTEDNANDEEEDEANEERVEPWRIQREETLAAKLDPQTLEPAQERTRIVQPQSRHAKKKRSGGR